MIIGYLSILSMIIVTVSRDYNIWLITIIMVLFMDYIQTRDVAIIPN